MPFKFNQDISLGSTALASLVITGVKLTGVRIEERAIGSFQNPNQLSYFATIVFSATILLYTFKRISLSTTILLVAAILLLAMAMAAPHRALWFALVCTIGSVLGGLFGYLLGWGLWGSIDQFFFDHIPGFTEAKFAEMASTFADNAFITIFTAGFTLIPFKIFTIAAGAAAVPLLAFTLGAVISRGLRFGLLALLIKLCGPSIKEWIDRYFNLITIVFTVLLIVGIVIWRQMH